MQQREDALYQSPILQRMTGPVLRPGGLSLTEESARICGLRVGERLLDVGCGYGEAASMLQRRFGVVAYGLDLDFSLLRRDIRGGNCRCGDLTDETGSDAWAQDIDNPKRACGMTKIQAKAEAIPFQASTFQVLLCECVLSLTPRMRETLAEFERVLSKGGRLILCDIYLRNPEADLTRQLKEIPMACGFRKALHREKIETLLFEAGFSYVWQDLSHILIQFAGQLVFEHGSLQQFWSEVFGGGGCQTRKDLAKKTCDIVRKSRPGYFRIFARKKEDPKSRISGDFHINTHACGHNEA